MKRKVCVITGTRAEYGLMYWVMRELEQNPSIELQIIATGMHLSPEFGLTYKKIEEDGFPLHKKIEILLSSDTPVGISKSIGLGVISFAEAFEELQPDIIAVLGDRFEILAAAQAAMISRIPIAHFHGGEATEGLIDEPIRHSISKMSHLHFTATEEYKNRVIQLGEQPDRVFNVGALGIENINRLELYSKEQFEESIGFKLNKRNILITFHPVTLEHATARQQFQALLHALDKVEDCTLIFTKPNADTDGRIIIEMIDRYVSENSHKAVGFTSLGQIRYLSALQYMDGAVGNSSSGLIEVPSFKIATIDIGDRQKGRIKADSVISCEPTEAAISSALDKMFSPAFKERLTAVKNPYGTENPSKFIVEKIAEVELEGILKKEFYDLR